MKKSFHLLIGILSVVFVIPSAYAGGSVTGKINFTGTAPERTKLDMNADPACAALNPEPLLSEDVILNADNTLQNVFVYVKQGLEGKTFDVPSQAVVLDQKGCHYNPHVFGLQINQPLEIINSDSTLHNVHGMPTQSKEFNLGMPIPGMKLTRKFEAPEVMVKFKCDVHPWMHAYAGVLTHPYFSVSSTQGTYDIKDLPAGEYVIEAWHEKYGVQTQNVTVTEGGTQTVDFTFAG